MIRRRDVLAALAGACTPALWAPAFGAQARGAAVAGPRGLPALGRFFASLDRVASGARKTPVSVLQIGDSHTANDGFSGRLRELFQQRFGDAGRGVLPPCVPFRYYRPDQVHVTAAGWELVSSFDPRAAGPFGITGLRQHSLGRADMALEVEQPGDLALVELEFLPLPGGGRVAIGFDSGPGLMLDTSDGGLIDTRLGDTRVREGGNPPAIWGRASAPNAMRMTVTTLGDGPVDMLSCRINRRDPGVTWSNLGTIGATVDLVSRWDEALLRAELEHIAPDLILLAFGTNEGFAHATDVSAYPIAYKAAIDMLRNAAPAADMMLIGPPDGVVRRRRAAPAACPGFWQEAGNLAAVRAAQQRVAHAEGLPYWDWSAAMGGRCSMVAWAAQHPPLAAADHVHLLHPGYRRTAEALFDDLMAEYAKRGSG